MALAHCILSKFLGVVTGYLKKIDTLIIWQRVSRILDNFLAHWIVRNLISFLILLRYIPVRWFCTSTSIHVTYFLGAFTKLWKATVSVVRSVPLSVCLSVRLSDPMKQLCSPPDGFSWNLIFEQISKICRENWRFIKISQEWRIIYMTTNKHFWAHLVHILLEWEMFQTKV